MQIGLSSVNRGEEVSKPQPRLVRAAQEFEGQMMKELLKPMTEGSSLTSDEESDGPGSSGVLGEFAGEAVGQALSRQGGFGIADRIVAQLSHSRHPVQLRESNTQSVR